MGSKLTFDKDAKAIKWVNDHFFLTNVGKIEQPWSKHTHTYTHTHANTHNTKKQKRGREKEQTFTFLLFLDIKI